MYINLAINKAGLPHGQENQEKSGKTKKLHKVRICQEI